MGLSVRERWKKGDRWFLVFVDPLLDKPAYFALTKDRVTVGFLSDCDWMLPCGQMGLDMVADSRRLDDSYNPMAGHAACNSWPWQGPIGRRIKEPFFELTFEPAADGEDPSSGCWSASCPEGHDCRVSRSLDLSLRWKRDCDDVTKANPASDVFFLTDGDVFEFVWPYWHYEPDDHRCSYNLPPQRLRFVFIEELDGEHCFSSLAETKKPLIPLNVPSLTSLPIEPLALIASFLEPEEFFRTLALVSRVFTSASMRGQIPWKNLELTNTFDCLRIPRMACQGAVRRIKALKPWDMYQRYAIYLKWKPLVTQETVVSLEIQDPRLLCSTGIPPNLEEITFLANDEHLPEFWSALYHLRLPVSTKKVKIRCTDQCLLRSVAGINVQQRSLNELENSDWHVDVGWLCHFVRNVEELVLQDIPFRVGSWNGQHEPVTELNNLRHLSVNNVDQNFHLLQCTSNLTALDVTVGSYTDADQVETLSANEGWARMESFTMRNGYDNETPLRTFMELMPNLMHLRLTGEDKLSAEFIADLADLLPHLEVLSIRHASIELREVADLLETFTSLVALTIVTSVGSVQGVSRSSFPRGKGVTVRWESWKDPGKSCEGFSFFYSKVTDDQLEKFMRKSSIGSC